ncbi:MAG: HNH endonuclease [Deltaproteobacteria bacterium]|nr:HNH endonuclease [Deltaproteobacteria bacterium]MDQ3299911.1 HNH endonuclease [Myxococcota bacterium]
MPTEGRSHRELTARIQQLGISTAQLRRRGWSRGETAATHPSVERTRKRNAWPDVAVFVENSPAVTGRNLVKRLRALGWAYCCAACGISDWAGKPRVLHFDHVNGIHNDSRFSNLRLLCRTADEYVL